MRAASSPLPLDAAMAERRRVVGVAVPPRAREGATVVDAFSALLCDRVESPRHPRVPDHEVARRLLCEQRERAEGVATGKCRSCHRRLRRPEYVARGTGEKCGGRIGHPRQPGVPPARRPVEGDGEDQLELFVVVKVRA